MRRLVFLVVGVRNEDRRKPVESDFAVGPRIFDPLGLVGSGQLEVVGVVVKRPRRIAAEDIGVERRIGQPAPETPAEARSDVAYAAQFVPYPALFEGGSDLGACISGQSAK